MNEECFYLENKLNGKNLFIHFHKAKVNNNKIIYFFNPIFDEKKRAQKFQAEVARKLCELNYNIVRFDYYGTGDSEGELFEFDLNESIKNIKFLLSYFDKRYPESEIFFLGIRLGADIALISALENVVKRLILIEPIVNGNKFLTEQRIRKKAFFKLNNMTNVKEFFNINSIKYEDFQGYLISNETINFISKINSDETSLEGIEVILFKLNSFKSNKLIKNLAERLSNRNKLFLKTINVKEFWSSLEPIDTTPLIEELIVILKLD